MWEIDTWTNNSHVYLDGVFSEDELLTIIKLGESCEIKSGVTFSGKDNYRKSNISWLHPNNDTAFMYHKLEHAIKAINSEFFKFDLTLIESLQYTEYDASYGGEYKAHLDLGKSEVASRKMSFSIQLTDPSEYEGGELAIYTGDLDNPEICKKEKGTMVAFPSTMLHAVKPVTRGKRQALVGWVRGPRFR